MVLLVCTPCRASRSRDVEGRFRIRLRLSRICPHAPAWRRAGVSDEQPADAGGADGTMSCHACSPRCGPCDGLRRRSRSTLLAGSRASAFDRHHGGGVQPGENTRPRGRMLRASAGASSSAIPGSPIRLPVATPTGSRPRFVPTRACRAARTRFGAGHPRLAMRFGQAQRDPARRQRAIPRSLIRFGSGEARCWGPTRGRE